jgi:hypothetical protein
MWWQLFSDLKITKSIISNIYKWNICSASTQKHDHHRHPAGSMIKKVNKRRRSNDLGAGSRQEGLWAVARKREEEDDAKAWRKGRPHSYDLCMQEFTAHWRKGDLSFLQTIQNSFGGSGDGRSTSDWWIF